MISMLYDFYLSKISFGAVERCLSEVAKEVPLAFHVQCVAQASGEEHEG